MKKIILLFIVVICIIGFSETEELKKGKEYFQNDRLKEAEKYFKLAEEKQDVDVYPELGKLYFFIGKKDLSEVYYKKGVEKGDAFSCYGLGKIYQINGDLVNAEKYFRIGVDRGSDISKREIDRIEGKENSRIVVDPSLYEKLEKGRIQYENAKAAGRIRH